ncbi:MAG: DUF3859 domain-containing protein [Pelagimonas sp.]|uniref:DUF3859 domain-containing protein n=1 Tax=Pelagimonas sp. TaxID=2073170 RepID=UPI003D6B635F
MHRFALPFALLVTPHMVMAADDVSPVTMLDYGVICDIKLGGTEPAPDTASGVINLIDQKKEVDVATAFVPAHIGLSFGLRTVLRDETELNGAKMRIIHPPMGPDGITQQSWHAPMRGNDPLVNLYSFETDDELVLGLWTFQLIHEGKVLIEQGFQVLPQGSVAEVQQVCFGLSLTS